MKVVFINTVYNLGSTGRIVADLKHILESNKDEAIVAFGRGYSDEANTYCISNRIDLYGHALLTRLTDKTGFYSAISTKRLIKLIKETQPDIIHLHNIHGYYLHVEKLFQFLKEYGKPVVWTIHDCWPFTGHCVYFEAFGVYEKCERWKSQCEKCDRLAEYPRGMVDSSKWNYMHKKKAFTSLDNVTIVTVSNWLKHQVEQSFLKVYPVETIYNGLDSSKFKCRMTSELRTKYNLQDKKIILGVASTWSTLKGISDFVKLSERLDERYQIVLLGIDEKNQKDLPSKILALPRTESIDELVDWYNQADVYFNASRAETFGMTVIEALACGTPVVSYDICAMREIMDEGTGYLVEKIGDIEEVVRLIALCDKTKMRDCCISRAHVFEKEIQYEKYMELYRMISNKVE